ncbi:GNAT family N-acetyltransferase [Gramella sp. KN1008]|uniref:GNAT family N-acetyltransferase n=1 Tax=Gramella sp. KN1008 TaxID=2529298 RepID=UPI001040773B|nr:GNAT family N-acetyltransferase [Gramella sp. KN1008]TBW26564.1 N-acetyltransferase [Gramella sp. KN1008]
MSFPILYTKRLLLNKLKDRDIPAIVAMASNKKISDLTRNIPHPYTENEAVSWLKSIASSYEKGIHYAFAIRLREKKDFIGTISLKLKNDKNAELAYWVGEEYWNHGYVTEAAKHILDFGFADLKLQTIFASYLKINKPSARVLEKIGMLDTGEMEVSSELNTCSIESTRYFSLTMGS